MSSVFRTALLVTFILLIGVSAFPDIENGLVIHFSFDDVDGTIVKNGVDNGIIGILEWEAYQAPGYLNKGVMLNPYVDELSPGKDFIRVRSDPRINVDEQFTIAVWVKSFSFGRYRSVMANTDNYGYALCIDGGRPSFWIHIAGSYLIRSSATVLEPDRWYHLALTFDGLDAILYLDGKEELKFRKKGAITRSRSDFFIGGEPSYTSLDPRWPAWHGVLDEFYFYSRALMRDEIGILIELASSSDSQ